MKKLLFIVLIIGGLIMLKPINVYVKNAVSNIVYRKNLVTGIITADHGNKSYDVEIGESGKSIKKIFTLSPDPDLAVGDKARIFYRGGCKEDPILMAPTKPTLIVSGDLIICCFETDNIWRCKGISNEVIDTLTNINNPSGLTVANGNLISANYSYFFVHDGFSETILNQFVTPYYYNNGLAFDGTNLISCDWYKKLIYIHNGLSASISNSFASPSTFPRGLTIINGDLISGDANSDMIYVHNGITSTIKSSFPSPKPYPNGLTNDGTNLISGDNGLYGVEDDMIYIHSGATGTILSSFSAPAGCLRVNGLAYFK